MSNYRDFVSAFRKLGLGDGAPVIVHTSLSTFGAVAGGAQAVVGALLASFGTIVIPTFTYQTMIIPSVGPKENALSYGSNQDANLTAEVFHPDMPVHHTMGAIAESFRTHPKVERSDHPILSFAGVNAEIMLEAQTIEEPLGTIGCLAADDSDVLLIGVDHRANTSLHYAEMLAGRKQFIRWSLTEEGVLSCPGFPGCSEGFNAIAPRLNGVVRRAQVGRSQIEAIPLRDLVHISVGWLREDPQALLCNSPYCQRCQATRKAHRISS